MSANNAKVQSIIENTFTTAVKNLDRNDSAEFINDLSVRVDSESGELQIYDENENLLEKVVIFDWMNKTSDENFEKHIISVLKGVLTILTTKKLFENSRILKPFSINLVDEEFIVSEELLFIGDDTFRLDDPLLKDLDAELDAFIKDLFSDMPK